MRLLFSTTQLLLYTTLWTWLSTPIHAWMPATLGRGGGTGGGAGYAREEISVKSGQGRIAGISRRGAMALPASKIRGVNLGSMFVFEPWIGRSAWEAMGCGSARSEFDCVAALGQARANDSFAQHWDSWIVQSDIQTMQRYGLNALRIGIGYWIRESLVYPSEHFPQGALPYLQRLCGWASDAGLYLILDLHGAPGAQAPDQPSTGQYAAVPGFFVEYEYRRGVEFLSWLANLTYTVHEFRNVGMIGIVNEPARNMTLAASMINDYYSEAYNAIRAVESNLGIPRNESLHIQVMDELWGSGNPNQNLSHAFNLAYDDHRYLKDDLTVQVAQSSYISNSCHSNRNSDKENPTIVGEFSLSPPDDVEGSPGWTVANVTFYSAWFAAQVTGFERYTDGWIFWTWKTQLGDYRWSYHEAVEAGVIPRDLNTINSSICNGGARAAILEAPLLAVWSFCWAMVLVVAGGI